MRYDDYGIGQTAEILGYLRSGFQKLEGEITMVRDEALNENDSGWPFMAGNEGEEYANDYRNLVLMTGGAVYQRDPAIFRHIDSPVGTNFVRDSPEAFEPDEEGKKIYMEQGALRRIR